MLTIKTRGPFAFQNLLLSLQQTDHEELAEMLDKQTDIFNNENSEISDNYFSQIRDTVEPLQIKVRKAKEFSSGPSNSLIETYQMRSNPRGLVLIITNIDYDPNIQKPRKSAIHDKMNLEKLFKDMGFSVETHCNLTGKVYQ